MRSINIYLIALLSLVFVQCQKKGTTINAKVQNAANMKAVMEMVYLNGNFIPVGKADIDANGSFKIELKEGVDPGFYRIKIGIKPIFLIFDGTEKNVNIESDLTNAERYETTVSGSKVCEYYVNNMKSFVANPNRTKEEIQKIVFDAPSAIAAAVLSFQTLPVPDASSLEYLKKVKERLDKENPNSNYAVQYAQGIAQLDKEINGTGGIKVGSLAPDIALPDPTGKIRKLSDLKGNIVLLDFWASWCRPCRMENPHVVQVYNKYKDKGFTVFSVSLDGINLQNRARMTPESIEKALKEAKDNWVSAIKQDGLPWDNHVSDLQQWDAAPAQLYGVQSIPQTFLIDKEGKILAINPRTNLEQELDKVIQ